HRQNLGEQSCTVEHTVEHVGCEHASEGVLLADVVRAEHRSAIRKRDFDAMTELRPRPQLVVRADRVPPELTECHDHAYRDQRLELALEVRLARVALERRRLVLWRRALHCRGDEAIVQFQAVTATRALRLVRVPGAME